jgi:hypothetical protein
MYLKRRQRYWVYFFAAAIVVLSISLLIDAPGNHAWFFGLLGVAWGVFYFLYQQHIEQARFFHGLFTEFNTRYDKLNEGLMEAICSSGDFGQEERDRFVDYFNLCAEEFLFYQAGYIDDRVWDSWQRGMAQYSADPRVAALWQDEQQTNSYYGFVLPIGQRNVRRLSNSSTERLVLSVQTTREDPL